MADLDNLVVTVGGDISDLQTAFDQIPAAAQAAADAVQDAFAGQTDLFSDVGAQAQQAFAAVPEAAATAAQARVLNFLLYFLRRHLVQGLTEALISTRMLIALEAESLAIRRYCLGKWSFRRHRYLHSSRIPSIFAASRLP